MPGSGCEHSNACGMTIGRACERIIPTAGCRLAALLGQFPLPRDSAEGEVISSSIVGKSGLSERQVSAKLGFPVVRCHKTFTQNDAIREYNLYCAVLLCTSIRSHHLCLNAR